MERGFYNDDFEQLIRQKADQYKMFPSDNVWKGIYRSLHTRRKWYGLGLLLFLAGISYIASLQLMSPAAPAKMINKQAPAASPSVQDNHSNLTISGPIVAGNTGTGSNAGSLSPFTPMSGKTPVLAAIPVYADTDIPHAIMITNLPDRTTIVDELYINSTAKVPAPGKINPGQLPVLLQQPEQTAPEFLILAEASPIEPASHELVKPVTDPAGKTSNGQQEDEKKINWLQEYAVYELTPPPMRRFGWQLSFSPTMNYRRLTSNSSVNDQMNVRGLPAGAIEGKPETLVSHRPALGFELGSHLVYTVNKNIRLRAGIQFNYSRYGIQAYTAPTPERGKIQLDAVGSRPDSLISYTRIRNFSGEKSEDLQNQYFQLSAPIGMELTLLGTEKLSFNVAGTIQPTYLLNRNSYLITTDFKNYMRAPSLVRRWNVNAGAEIFLSYKTGSLSWATGVQFRRQLLSSYVKEYPIREYLMEYGVKIGVTKTIR